MCGARAYVRRHLAPRLPDLRPIGGESGRSGLAAASTVGEGHVCTHCGLELRSSGCKVCNGRPLLRTLVRKVEKYGQVARTCGESHHSPFVFGRFRAQVEPVRVCLGVRLSNERSEKCQWKCPIRTRCHHRTVVESNHCISGEFPPPNTFADALLLWPPRKLALRLCLLWRLCPGNGRIMSQIRDSYPGFAPSSQV